MGYGRTIKKSDLARLRPLFEALETLPEGRGISYTDHPIQISKDRTIIYTYFDINNQKGIFKLTNPCPKEIKIIRLETFTPAVSLAARLSEFTPPPAKTKRFVAAPAVQAPRVHATGPGMEFVRDHLLMEEDEGAAVKALSEQGLSPEDQAVGLSEWKRINNKE